MLLSFSAFFSAAEIAFFSLDRVALGRLRQSDNLTQRLAARLMEHPGNLLTSILMANSIVNIFLGIAVAGPSELVFSQTLQLPSTISYPAAVMVATAFLVFFGEVTPKVIVVQFADRYAALSAIPIYITDLLLTPIRVGVLYFLGLVFRATGFSKLPPAPFITDEEFLSVLTQGEESGALDRGEREMIQGILEFSEVMLKEVLVPRPDMIALPEKSTIGEAIALFRKEEYARMPVYAENLDHIVGILYAKDLLPFAERGAYDDPIQPLLRKPHFAPETMTVASFVKMAQRLRVHLAIVVDEYGGTEGLITLQDALREVVGDIGDDTEDEAPMVHEIHKGVYRVDGSLPLHELEELTGVPIQDEEHTTVAGFLMDQTDRIPEVGDRIEHAGVTYTVEAVEGKRVALLRIQVPEALAEEAAP